MADTISIARTQWTSYARRVARECRKRWGTAQPFQHILDTAAPLIVADHGSTLVVRQGWTKAMRAAAAGEPPAASLGARIRQARRTAGWSQARLATAIGLAAPNLSLLESGTHQDPKLSTVLKIAQVLGLSLDHLCGHTPTPVPRKEEQL